MVYGIVNYNDYIWKKQPLFYLIDGDITCDNDVSLGINPGCILKFNAGTGLQIRYDGYLNAQGTVSETITFTSAAATPSPGDWDGIMGGEINLSYCTIEYGNVNISSIENDLILNNCTINNSKSNGISSVNSEGYPANISNCTISNSGSNGIFCSQSVIIEFDNCTISKLK